MLCGWEGNRRSGVALAMRHRLSGLSTYRINGLHHWGMAPFTGIYYFAIADPCYGGPSLWPAVTKLLSMMYNIFLD